MVKRMLLAALFLLSATGCANYHKELDQNPPFSEHRYRYFDVEILWRAQQSDNVIRITGSVRNLRVSALQDLELTARIVNQQRRVVARAGFTDFPNLITTGKTQPFSMELTLPPGTSPKELHLSYFYLLAEAAPEIRNDEDPHFGSFESPL